MQTNRYKILVLSDLKKSTSSILKSTISLAKMIDSLNLLVGATFLFYKWFWILLSIGIKDVCRKILKGLMSLWNQEGLGISLHDSFSRLIIILRRAITFSHRKHILIHICNATARVIYRLKLHYAFAKLYVRWVVVSIRIRAAKENLFLM